MKEKLKRFFTEYSREKIIALFVTFIIWTFAVNRNQETRSFTVKVNVKTSQEHVLVSDPVSTVHVKVSGSVFDFAGIEKDDLALKIDLSNRKPGKFTRFLDSGMLNPTPLTKPNFPVSESLVPSGLPASIIGNSTK